MRRFQAALVAIGMIALLATDAASQCTITHTAVSGAYELCAVGGSEFQWSGPGGFTASDACISVSLPGTYTLSIFDGLNGLWGPPCSFSFTEVPVPTCPITGPDSVCTGATVTWCAPSGSYQYNWMGPNGSLGTGACIVLSEPGDYTIDYYDPATGNGDVCTRTLYATTCAPPPPPPPTREASGCPLTSREWSRTCGARGALVDPSAFAAVATAVDARSAVWSFTNASEGLCKLLRRGGRMNDRDVACRQYAALLANLVAGERNVIASDGRKVGLDPAMLLDGVRGVPAGTTVTVWVDRTEATLLAQSARPARSRDSRDECRRIAYQARAIMRTAPGCGTTLAAAIDDEDEPEAFGVSAAAPAAGTISTTQGHDPLTGARRMRWTLERASDVQLDIVDVTGRKVRHLAEGVYAAGPHDFGWDGRDDDGRVLRAGAYFVVGRVGGERTSARLFLLK